MLQVHSWIFGGVLAALAAASLSSCSAQEGDAPPRNRNLGPGDASAGTGNGGSAASPSGGASGGGAGGSGGVTSTGGASSGGSSSGGASTGGSSAGGTSAGGTSVGGSSTGGTSAGGSSTGGTSTGGTSTGGTSTGGTSNGGSSTGGSGGGPMLERFSFFVTSLAAVRAVSGNPNGFGGDLRHGQATGLAGADEICATIAERSMPGSRSKVWRAFLSTSTEHARDRIGNGPWYDRIGRLVAMNLTALLGTRPGGADPAIADDLPNEDGVPNRRGSAEGMNDDNHDMITGSRADGTYAGTGTTCNDWTAATANAGRPMTGHAWPAFSGQSWIQAHPAPGCTPSVNLVQTGPGSGTGIGNAGGYGGFYCFALSP